MQLGLSSPQHGRMMYVSRLVRDSFAIVVKMMYGAQNLSSFKNHLDNVHIAVHDGSQRRGMM
jgi:hypothetical protein